VAGLAEFDANSLRNWHQTAKIAPAAKFLKTKAKAFVFKNKIYFFGDK
jgi:hypothetical protein